MPRGRLLTVPALLLAIACGGGSEARRPIPPPVSTDVPAAPADAPAPPADAPPAPADPPPTPPAPEAPPATPAGPSSGTHEGTIASRKGKILVLDTKGGDRPQAGAVGSLSKKFKQKIFGADVEGWLDVATVRVDSATDTSVTLTITEEKSEVVVNGEKQNHFKPGFETRLKWNAP